MQFILLAKVVSFFRIFVVGRKRLNDCNFEHGNVVVWLVEVVGNCRVFLCNDVVFVLRKSGSASVLSFANVEGGCVRAKSALDCVNAITRSAGSVLGDGKGLVVRVIGNVGSGFDERAHPTVFGMTGLTPRNHRVGMTVSVAKSGFFAIVDERTGKVRI